MKNLIRRTLWSSMAMVWIALVAGPAQAIIPPEPGSGGGGGSIAPLEPIRQSFWDTIPFGLTAVLLAVAVVLAAAALSLVARVHHPHHTGAQAH